MLPQHGGTRVAALLPGLCAAQQLRQQVLPPFRLARGAVAVGLRGRRNLVIGAVLHALDLTREDSELAWATLVVGRVQRQHARLGRLQPRRWVIVPLRAT